MSSSEMSQKLPPEEGRNLTIHDVARHAGVSAMTVSRVISRKVNVREPLRSKVLASIEALNYSVNEAARSTRAGQAKVTLGILYSNPSAGYLNQILLGALEETSRGGGQLLLESCDGLQSQKKAMERLIQKGVDGIILPPPLCDSAPTVHMLKREGIPVLALATAAPLEDVSAVRIDDFEAAAAMTRYLIELGHKRIGFIKGDPQHTPTLQRLRGFQAAMAEAGLDIEESLIAPGMYTYQSGLTAAEQLLNLPDRPTAIFASNDEMAAAVISLCHGMKIKIPYDLSVCGFDDTPLATTIWPQITTIHQPLAEMGQAAVATIADKIREIREGKTLRPRQLVMKYTLQERASTGPVPRPELFGVYEGGILPR
ncbi:MULTISPECIES: LacI family DNA-binding transcriptional regulator [Asticcacaulis]|uniref:LacI family DNA-binding transcriptional regulator n=1 Tax=Asticcacaulis TaxID=76890 RepID=UPI001AE9B7FA|nr:MULTISPECIES: LacI family DNA-binding transcriptional regulator [Asticcacaulis]MBP2157900.1 LacI family transcriptional regulator [Asticcacaulis solisilvae]MDR6798945.1 LacI family transcriptional regulator [Asticcacaulis sp. BE141]